MLPNYPVQFDGNDLGGIEDVVFYNYEFNKLPNRILTMGKLARADKSILTSAEYSSKEIPLYGQACGGSRAGTEEALSAVKALTQGSNRQLVVNQAGLTVGYTSTMNEFNIEWDGIIAYFEVVFVASDPIGQETTPVLNAINEVITTAMATLPVVIESSYKVEPIFTITVNSITGGTGQTMTVANGRNGQGIILTRDYAASDVIVINVAEKTVVINGAFSDFAGQFPLLDPANQSVSYIDTFSARNVTVNMQYTRRLT